MPEHNHLWIQGMCALCPASLYRPSIGPDSLVAAGSPTSY